MKIAIVGKGVFGTALGSLLEANSVPFQYVERGDTMPRGTDVIVLALPAMHIAEALETHKSSFGPRIGFVNVAKGMDSSQAELPFEIVQRVVPGAQYANILGPSFADGIKRGRHIMVSLGSNNEQFGNDIATLFTRPHFFPKRTPHYKIIELAGALKNVYAILAGLAEGLRHDCHMHATIVGIAVAEIEEAARALGFSFDTSSLPGVLGDIVLTCSSMNSRNYRFGRYLAVMQAEEALRSVGSTVEGYHTALRIPQLILERGVSLPLASVAEGIIKGVLEPRAALHQGLGLPTA